jgi:hypothetical protein
VRETLQVDLSQKAAKRSAAKGLIPIFLPEIFLPEFLCRMRFVSG